MACSVLLDASGPVLSIYKRSEVSSGPFEEAGVLQMCWAASYHIDRPS